jgi:hypothetical protein
LQTGSIRQKLKFSKLKAESSVTLHPIIKTTTDEESGKQRAKKDHKTTDYETTDDGRGRRTEVGGRRAAVSKKQKLGKLKAEIKT